MTATRVSNKQVLEAIENGFAQLAAALTQNTATTVADAPILTPISEPTAPNNESTIKVDGKYKTHMESKFLAYSTKIGEPVVGYAYKKSNGHTGLWSVPASKWAKSPKIKNLLGPIGVYGDDAS